MENPISAAEEAQTLALLAQSQPGMFPTVSPTGQTSRLHGRFAKLSLAIQSPQLISASLLCFDWEIEFTQEFAEATAHGDFWRVRIPLTQDWSGRVRGYLTRADTSYLAAISDNVSNTGLGADPKAMTLTLYDDAGTHVIFAGACWGQRGRVMAPMALVTQELELVSAAVPTTMMVV
jgi:hypothetical protein